MRNPVPSTHRLTPLEVGLLHALQRVLVNPFSIKLKNGEKLVLTKVKETK
jgi:hypothetical protein